MDIPHCYSTMNIAYSYWFGLLFIQLNFKSNVGLVLLLQHLWALLTMFCWCLRTCYPIFVPLLSHILILVGSQYVNLLIPPVWSVFACNATVIEAWLLLRPGLTSMKSLFREDPFGLVFWFSWLMMISYMQDQSPNGVLHMCLCPIILYTATHTLKNWEHTVILMISNCMPAYAIYDWWCLWCNFRFPDPCIIHCFMFVDFSPCIYNRHWCIYALICFSWPLRSHEFMF